ncbi:hypothetical protein RUM43_003594 [Polyplax serrata]|uniref:Uncharacterized protein n=1 Tax=Polyplax serrata TaxID=468196 RepID=A0AAN8P2L5_POLSC
MALRKERKNYAINKSELLRARMNQNEKKCRLRASCRVTWNFFPAAVQHTTSAAVASRQEEHDKNDIQRVREKYSAGIFVLRQIPQPLLFL